MSAQSQGDSNPASAEAFRAVRRQARTLFEHALAECSIEHAFHRHIEYHDGNLRVGDAFFALPSLERVIVLSLGKAGHSMVQALGGITGGGFSGIVACPDPPAAPVEGFTYFIGGHPLPNANSLRAGDAMLRLLAQAATDSYVIFLISGGASAIAEWPIRADIGLDDVVATYKALVHSGAPIAEINAVRKHLSALKGGRMALAAAAAQHQVSVLVSDVPEKSLDALASGPTMPDSTTVADCYGIVAKYGLLPHFPPSVRRPFEQQALEESPKAGDAAFARSSYATVLSNATAVHAACEAALQAGYTVEVDNSCDDWDYIPAADHLLERLRHLRRSASRPCVISGGEVTVRVSGKSGVGGRNQQFALYCAQKIAGENVAVLSAGTDGIDGNSPAAGAVADGSTWSRAEAAGLDVAKVLAGFDAYPLFQQLGDAIVTGPTGNNVRDLRILLTD